MRTVALFSLYVQLSLQQFRVKLERIIAVIKTWSLLLDRVAVNIPRRYVVSVKFLQIIQVGDST